MAAAFAVCVAMSAQAESADLNGGLTLTSQLVDRGLAITPATPTLQGSVAWTYPSDWSLGVSGGVEIRSGHVADSLARLSRAWSSSNEWQTQTSLSYYRYSGVRHTSAFEGGIAWIYRDILTIGLAAVYTVGVDEHRISPAVDLDLHWPLARRLSFSAGVGMARYVAPYQPSQEYDPRGFYRYGQTGLAWVDGPWRLELDRIAVDPGSRRRLEELVAPPWLATISWSF